MKGGRPRKMKKFSFFDFNIRRSHNKVNMSKKKRLQGGLKVKSSQAKIPHNHQGDKIEAKDILQLGKELGLTPNFSDNDTLSIIQRRITGK